MSKPSLASGTRDFGPEIMAKRNYIIEIIKRNFALYGFQPLETPAMENLTTLMGKYGEEGDKLLFKIINSGDYLSKVSDEVYTSRDAKKLLTKISEKGLRYDLTVPFARYVAMNHSNLPIPFKRYQIQPVWRADRPQKGRYREFYQCDADVIGSEGMLNEVELLQIIDDVFSMLKMKVVILVNNRKILDAIAAAMNATPMFAEVVTALDKIDKIGWEKVAEEIEQKGVENEGIKILENIVKFQGSNSEKIALLKTQITGSSIGVKAIEEIEELFAYLQSLTFANELKFDLSLARGLSYYTGTILEVRAVDVQMGSITGGGRYDNLTGVFGLNGMSGVGFSFGLDRIYDVMEELNLFPMRILASTRVLFINFDYESQQYACGYVQELRKAGIAAEIFPDMAKLKKQMQYANDKNIPYVVMIGEEERKENYLSVKNMITGEQEKKSFEGLKEMLGAF